MKLLYFAWIRTKVGFSGEEVALPAGVDTVGQLIEWLKTRGPNFTAALADQAVVRVAVNQEYARADHPVRDSDEVALFPPVTGGRA